MSPSHLPEDRPVSKVTVYQSACNGGVEHIPSSQCLSARGTWV